MKKNLLFLVIITAFAIPACTGMSATEKGAAAGGVIGAGTGAIIGHQVGHTAGGALIGGAVGAVTGGLIGSAVEQPQGKQQTTQSHSYQKTPQSNCDIAYADFSRARSMQRTDDKIYYYKKGLKICPDYYDAHYELGLIYKKLGSIEEAKYEFRRTLEIKPDHYDAKEALKSLSY